MGGLFFVLGIQPSQAALANLYNKATSSTLAAYEWNNLLSDFVTKNNGGDRLDGYFSINTATSSTYALDINGALRATNLTGALSGTLNAGNVSTGAFGLNTGGGNYNFPANIGIGIGTATPASIITLANNRWVSALNSTGTGYVNMFRVNANDEIEVGGALNIGQFQFAADSGFNTFVDMPVTNAPAAGTIMGYTMKVDGDNILNVYSEANGSGGIQNRRIGIGTSTPAFTLDVNGIINASALYVNGAPYIGSQWTTNGTSVYYNTGNVGIGTTTPIATLDVNGLIKMRTALITANEDVINKGYLDSALASTTAQIITQVATSSFWQGSMAGSIYNANSGSVGIGTTNPSGKLHITDASNTTRYASFSSTGLLTINFQDGTGSIPFLTLQNPYGNMGVSSHILFKSGYAGTTYVDSGRITLGHEVDWTSTAATRDSYLALFTSLDGALGEKMRITSAGNVGIGVTNPIHKLQISSGNLSLSDGNFIDWGNGSTRILSITSVPNNRIMGFETWNSTTGRAERMRIDGVGNVGIGTTNPTAKLYVNGTSIFNDIATFTQPVVVATPILGPHAATKSYVDSTIASATSSITLWGGTIGGNVWNLNSGNVGIGTTSPGISKLRIEHNAWTTYGLTLSNTYTGGRSWNLGDGLAAMGMFSIRDETAGQVRLTINGNGNVGIGTTTPGTKLTVVGSGNYSIDAGNYRVGNVATPVAALDAVNKSYLDSAVGTAQTAFWNINGSNLYASSTSWNVGVGTTAPDSRLHIVGTGQPLLHIQNSNGTDGITAGILFGVTNATDYQQAGIFFERLGGSAEGSLHFATKNGGAGNATKANARMTINASGNVGIGTTNPDAKLQVQGTLKLQNVVSSSPDTNFRRMINVASYNGGGTYRTGILTVKLPSPLAHSMAKIKISGWSYGQAWDVIVSGYLNTTQWTQVGGTVVTGNPPFNTDQIRLVADSASDTFYILLGDAATTYGYYASIGVDVDSIYSNNLPSTGWDIYIAASDPSFDYVTTPASSLYGSHGADINNGNVYINDAVITSGTPKAAITKEYLTSSLEAFNSETNLWKLNGSNLYASTTTWNVGIGTSSPATKLDVWGNIYINSATHNNTTTLAFATNGSPYHQIFSNRQTGEFSIRAGVGGSGHYLTFGSGDGSEKMRITTTGNVGIGTNNPAGLLELYKAGSNANLKLYAFSSSAYDSQLQFSANTNAAVEYSAGLDNNDNNFKIYSGENVRGTNEFVINPSGNVGIGTTNPTAKLYVNGTSIFNDIATFTQPVVVATPILGPHAATKSYVDSTIASATSSITLWGGTIGGNVWNLNSGNVGIGTTNALEKLDLRDGNLYISDSDLATNSAGGAIKFGRPDGYASNWLASIGSYTTTGYDRIGLTFNTSFGTSQERIRITPEGNVGIGTTNPTTKLHIENGVIRANNIVAVGSSAAHPTGIGSYIELYMLGEVGRILPYDGASYKDLAIGDWNGGNPNIMLKVGGNVGIGNGSPSNKLSVAGSADFSGNVGIGTTNPTAKLYVNGTSIFNDIATFTQPVVVATPILGPHAATKSYVDSTIASATSSIATLWGGTVGGHIWNLNSGNVGIGVASPESLFEVERSATGTVATFDVNTTNRATVQLSVFDNYAQLQSYGRGSSSGYLSINPLGNNVGIGTTNPGSYKLNVNGSTNISGSLNVTGTTTAGAFVGPVVGTINARNVSSGAFGADAGGGNFSFPANVGIGTTNPGSRLTINGVGASSTPLTLLQVFNMIPYATGNGLGAARIEIGHGTLHGYIESAANSENNSADGYMAFGTRRPTNNVTEAMRIDQSGNIGIGTTTPDAKLSVNGGATFNTGAGLAIGNVGSYNKLITYSAGPVFRIFTGGSYGSFGAGSASIGASYAAISSPAGGLIVEGNVGIGTSNPGAYRLKVAGDMAVTGTLQTQTGSDFAEEFSVDSVILPGTVVVMADNGHKSVRVSTAAYDRKVVGIVSDNPSIIAGRIESGQKVVVAMMGVVSVNVTSANGKIEKGDLLTSSNLPGYAMKVTEFAPGTVIGKALEDLVGKKGKIKVLVNLQ